MGTTTFVWDPVFDCVTHELDENNAVKAVYHNEPQQYGGVLSQRRGNTSHYHHHDALGSTRFLTDSSGNVTDTYLNDAWGNSVASTGSTVNPFKWVGKYGYYTDNSTGQVHVRARMYQPTVARWCSVDPERFADGPNNYVYVAQRATSYLDPSGFEIQTLDRVIDIGGTLRIKAHFLVFNLISEVCVDVVLERYLNYYFDKGIVRSPEESYSRYREEWNRRLSEGQFPTDPENPIGRGISSDSPDRWLFPNLALLLNGCDPENHYGGPYRTRRGIVPDDDFLVVWAATFSSIANSQDHVRCDAAETNCWGANGPASNSSSDAEKRIQHSASSQVFCVDKCERCIGQTTSIRIHLRYADKRANGKYDQIVDIPLEDGVLGTGVFE